MTDNIECKNVDICVKLEIPKAFLDFLEAFNEKFGTDYSTANVRYEVDHFDSTEKLYFIEVKLQRVEFWSVGQSTLKNKKFITPSSVYYDICYARDKNNNHFLFFSYNKCAQISDKLFSINSSDTGESLLKQVTDLFIYFYEKCYESFEIAPFITKEKLGIE